MKHIYLDVWTQEGVQYPLNDMRNTEHDVDAVDRYGRTKLYLACRHRDLRAVKRLIENGAGPTLPNQCIKGNGRDPLMGAIEAKSIPIIQFLLSLPCAVRIIHGDSYVVAPIHRAVTEGTPEIVELLIAHGASVNDPSNLCQRFPLHMAIAANKFAIMRVLLKHNASITLRNKDQETTLVHAAKIGSFMATWIILSMISKDNSDHRSMLREAIFMATKQRKVAVLKLLFGFCKLYIDHLLSPYSEEGYGLYRCAVETESKLTLHAVTAMGYRCKNNPTWFKIYLPERQLEFFEENQPSEKEKQLISNEIKMTNLNFMMMEHGLFIALFHAFTQDDPPFSDTPYYPVQKKIPFAKRRRT